MDEGDQVSQVRDKIYAVGYPDSSMEVNIFYGSSYITHRGVQRASNRSHFVDRIDCRLSIEIPYFQVLRRLK